MLRFVGYWLLVCGVLVAGFVILGVVYHRD